MTFDLAVDINAQHTQILGLDHDDVVESGKNALFAMVVNC
jgi:hypothetical protein